MLVLGSVRWKGGTLIVYRADMSSPSVGAAHSSLPYIAWVVWALVTLEFVIVLPALWTLLWRGATIEINVTSSTSSPGVDLIEMLADHITNRSIEHVDIISMGFRQFIKSILQHILNKPYRSFGVVR